MEFDSYIVPESDLEEGFDLDPYPEILILTSENDPTMSISFILNSTNTPTPAPAPEVPADLLTTRCQNQLINGTAGKDYASQTYQANAVLDTRELREEVAIRYTSRGGNLPNVTVRPLRAGTYAGELRVCKNDTPANMSSALFDIIKN